MDREHNTSKSDQITALKYTIEHVLTFAYSPLLRALVAKPRGNLKLFDKLFRLCKCFVTVQVFCICASVLCLCKCFVFVQAFCICGSVL